MSSEPRYQREGYCVPVPMRPSSFTSLRPEHQACNVEVALGQIAPFGFARGEHAPDDLLYADLQVGAAVGAGLRLGSGRSGFYKGKYLKGVGRTPLAGNWNVAEDTYHGTGHLMPSAAVREYIVSRYLEARGAAQAIVPCEGLLLAPLHPALQGFERAAFPGEQLSPVDLHLQAISVKGCGFARHSNFVWALSQVRRMGQLGRVFGSLHHHATCGADVDTSPDAAGIARALSASVGRALDNFTAYVRAGVYWGSFNNNFTLDGRFLDLELPLIFGRPFLGLTSTRPELSPDDLRTTLPVVGCEALEYLLQIRAFVIHVQQRLRFLLELGALSHPVERAFVAELVDALGAEFNGDHVVMNEGAACAAVTAALAAALQLAPGARPELKRIVAEQYGSHFRQTPTDLRGLPFRRLPVRLARIESISRYHAFYPDFLDLDGDLEEARHLNRALEEIDGLTSVDAVLSAVGRLEAELAGDRPSRSTIGPSGAA